jgi:hypothetical protein
MAVEKNLIKPKRTVRSRKQPPEVIAEYLQNWTLEMLAQHVRVHAYHLWECAGRPEGNEIDIWLRAEQEMLTNIISKSHPAVGAPGQPS